MSVLQRLSNLITADVNAVIDSIEDPEGLLKQSIRTMQTSVDELDSNIKTLKDQQQQINKQLQSIQADINTANQEIDICLKNENDTLAKHAIKQKLELINTKNLLQQALDDLSEKFRSAQVEQAQQLSDLDEIRRQAQLYQSGSANLSIHTPNIDAADIEIGLLKEKQARSQS